MSLARFALFTLTPRGLNADESLAGDFDALLRLLREHPDSFARTAAAWHARWCVQLPELTLSEACTARSALEQLQGHGARTAAGTLREIARRHHCDRIVEIIERWLIQAETSRAVRKQPR